MDSESNVAKVLDVKPQTVCDDDDDFIGLSCCPPGMTAEEAEKFNDVFRKMSSTEQSEFFSDLVYLARASGVPVIDIGSKTPNENK